MARTIVKQIKAIVKNLSYISETDAPLTVYIGTRSTAVTSGKLLSKIKRKGDKIEELGFERFFSRLTRREDWHGDQETFRADKYTELYGLLKLNLRDLKVFKIGDIEKDIYIVGLDETNKLTGIKTFALET